MEQNPTTEFYIMWLILSCTFKWAWCLQLRDKSVATQKEPGNSILLNHALALSIWKSQLQWPELNQCSFDSWVHPNTGKKEGPWVRTASSQAHHPSQLMEHQECSTTAFPTKIYDSNYLIGNWPINGRYSLEPQPWPLQ